MESLDCGACLADVFEPLRSKLGNRLTVQRDGSAVRWGYDGRSALIELRSDGALDATFIDRAAVDRVSASLAAPVYRRSGSGYRMDAGGCERMICDLVDFFSGTREPGFTFVGAYASGSRFASAT